MCRNPNVVGSVTFYEAANMGGLGLYRKRLTATSKTSGPTSSPIPTNTCAPGTSSARRPPAPPPAATQTAELRWTATIDALGLIISLSHCQILLDLGESWWKSVICLDASGGETSVHDEARKLPIPAGSMMARLVALPACRDNRAAGHILPVSR